MNEKPELCAGGDRPLAAVETFDPEPVKRGQVRRSRMGRRRAVVLLLVHLAIFAHIAHWLISGETVSPLEPSEAMYTVAKGTVNAGTILLLGSLLATLILGRWFCGWACHLVALQDGCAWLLKKVGIRPRPLKSRLLMWVPLLAGLHLFLMPAIVRWDKGLPNPELSNDLMRSNFWETFPGPVVAVLTFVVCGFVMVYLLGAKGFCTYACPYGGLFGVIDRFSPFRIRVTDACKGCGHCSAVCTSNVAVAKEVHEWGAVVDPGCMKCMDCVSVCPENALYFGAGAPAIKASPKVKHRKQSATQFGIGEEVSMVVAFSLSLLVLRGLPRDYYPWAQHLYGEMPQLFALGISAIVAFMAVVTWRLVKRPDVQFQKWALKSEGKLTGPGRRFGVFAGLLIAFMIHSAIIQGYMWRGTVHWERTGPILTAAWRQDAAVLGALTPEMLETVESGASAFSTAGAIGLFPDSRIHQNLGWFALCQQDLPGAAAHLQAALEINESYSNIWYFLARVRVLQGRYDDAWSALASCKSHNTDSGGFAAPARRLVNELNRLGSGDALLGLLANAPDDLAGSPDLLIVRAEVRRFFRKIPDALSDFERVLAEPSTHFLGLAPRLQELALIDPGRTIPMLTKARDARPDVYAIPMILVACHAQTNDLAAAESEARAMIERWKDSAPEGFQPGHPHMFLADIVEKRGNPQEAARLRAHARKIAPDTWR